MNRAVIVSGGASCTVSVFPVRTPTLPPATHTNSYAIGSREVVLVEPATPYEEEQRAWIDWVRGMPSRGQTPIAIFATHYHRDHVGGLEVLSRECGLPVWTHELTAKKVGTHLVQRHLSDGDSIVLNGVTNERWRVLHTPGHSWDHLCLFNAEEGVLLVGDMVASVGTILIAPGDGDMQVYLDQLDRLARLGATTALPAHGTTITDPKSLFRRYVLHRLMREAKVLSALEAFGADGATDAELCKTAYGDTPEHLFPLAILSLRSHLKKLVDDGKAIMATAERYRANP